eukprot:89854_1
MALNRMLRTGLCSLRPKALALSSSRCMASQIKSPTLNPQTIETVKATAPVLADHGYNIMTTMYERMLPEHPSVSELFNPSHQVTMPGQSKASQPWALACAVHAYAKYVDDLGVLAEAVERVAQKHTSLQIKPEHYAVVGECLLWAIKEELGDAATPEIMTAWEEAFGFLANVFITREEKLREEKKNQVGGWVGWRNFVVDDKVMECDDVASFYFRPEDGGKLPTFLPGQYIGIRIETPEFNTQRNYTLSNAPGQDKFRITVRREAPRAEGAPEGVVSSYLHDKVEIDNVVQLSVPCGDFTMNVDHDKPIVLLSGGVGITPVLAMLEYLIEKGVTNKIVMMNVSRNPNVEPMHDLLAKYRRKHLNLIIKTLYDDGPGMYPQGPITMDKLDQVLMQRDCHYYFCGPTGFMKAIYQGLLNEWNIPKGQIHYEFFGPHDDLLS